MDSLVDLHTLYNNDKDGYATWLADLNAAVCVRLYTTGTVLSIHHPVHKQRAVYDYWRVGHYDDLFEAIEDALMRVNNKLWNDNRVYLFTLFDLMGCWSENSSFEEYYLKELCNFTAEDLSIMHRKAGNTSDYDSDILNRVTVHAEECKNRFFVTPRCSKVKWHGKLNNNFKLNVYDETTSKVSSDAITRIIK